MVMRALLHRSRLVPGGRLMALVCSGLVAAAAPLSAARAQTEAEAAEARGWLLRLHDAAHNRSFEGTFVIGSGNRSTSLRVAHYCDGRNQFERIESLDGEQRISFRQNDVVQTVWPERRTVVIEQKREGNAFPQLLKGHEDRIVEFYDLDRIGGDRVAGLEADVLRLSPRDAYRYGWRLWAEKSTGLLLRAEVLASNNQVLEWSSFSNVVIGPRPTLESVQLPRAKVEGFRVVQTPVLPAEMAREGWAIGETPPGFRFVRAVKRSAIATDAPRGQAAEPRVLQAIYSDGVTFVSVFVEPYGENTQRKELLMTLGATHTLTRRQGDWWITVVGDVPAVTLRWFASRLQRED